MKIAYIANARMPSEKAHGIQLAKMCEALVKSGVDLELIIPARNSQETRTIKEFYGLEEEIKTKKLPVLNFFRETGWGFNFSAFTFAISYFFYLLKKKIRRELNIVYTIDLDQFSFFLIPLLGVPYFIEIHDAKRKNFIYSFVFSRAKGIIAINRLIKEKIIKDFCLPENKIIVHPNGIDLDLFSGSSDKGEARRRLGLPLNKRVILYNGRFYDWKGLDTLVSAARRISPALFYFVGGTKRDLEAILGGVPVSENVICVGQKQFSEMPLWLSAADIFVVLGTKRNDYSYYFTSPMKIFEYMASGRPIVASRTPAIMEIVSNQEVVFYEPDNADDLTAKINYIMSNHQEVKEKIKKAREKVKEFSWERRAKGILKFIDLCV